MGEFRLIRHNAQGIWLNQPTEDWSGWLPVASKEVKLGKGDGAIFKLHSLGMVTSRDEWVYGFSESEVSDKTQELVDFYTIEQERFRKSGKSENIELFVSRDIK
jgi:predicted helicase